MRTSCTRSWYAAGLSILATLSLATAANVDAQDRPTQTVCDGRIISAIDIAPEPAPALLRGFASTILRYRTTQPAVVRPFLLLREGDPCNEARRLESARLLRRQRYLASARISVLPDTGETVRLLVETEDEFPLLIGGDFSGGVSAITFGSTNINGRGLLAGFSWRDGEAYRDGWGIRVEQTPLLDRPWRLRATIERAPLGHNYLASVGQEFITNLQRFAWHGGYREQRSYVPMRRAGDEFPLAVIAERDLLDVGGVVRIGGRNLGIFGGTVLTHEEFSRNQDPVIIGETGLLPGDPAVIGDRYPAFSSTRIAAVVGLRALRFEPVIGVATLAAEQDLPIGLQAGLQLGRSVPWFDASDRDNFVSLDLFLGQGSPASFLGASGELEGRRDRDSGRWDGIVGSTRVAWYLKPRVNQTWEVSTEFSGVWRERIPTQLSLGDALGGLRGFRGAVDGGARRAVARVERRQVRGYLLGERAVWGYGLFADAGKLWSGDVPYGVTTSVRGSVGVSLLAAVPPRSRRMIRVDLAVPVTTGSPDDWQVRFLTVNTNQRFWREPNDVFRARTGSSPSNIFQWP